MNEVEISVIMSVYNGEKYIQESIKSILEQSFTKFEFIIIDDASSDSSLEIIKSFKENDKRIKIIENKNTIGLTKSLNKGLKISKGKYIARQDHDDISLADRFKEQYKFLENNKNIILCGTNYDVITNTGAIIDKGKTFITDSKEIKMALSRKNCIFHSSIMFRNTGLSYREKFYYTQDYDLYLNLISEGYEICNLATPLILWRMNEHSISFSKANIQREFFKIARRMYKQRMKNQDDGYNVFDNKAVLNISSTKNSRELVLESEIIMFLQKNDFRNARKLYYEKYASEGNINWLKKQIVHVFVKFPATYRTYRRILYNKQSAQK